MRHFRGASHEHLDATRPHPGQGGQRCRDRAAKTGKADITLDLTTLSAASSSLEGTLKGERLFNVAQGPTARFVGDTFTFDGDKLASVGGTLTILGKSQPTTLRATRFNCYENAQLKREVCGGDFAATVQRSQFGLGFLPNVTPDAVPLLIQVEAIRQCRGAYLFAST